VVLQTCIAACINAFLN